MYKRVGLASLGVAGLAGLTIATAISMAGDEPTVCDSVGADVIVGVLPNVSNYASNGGIEALAVGTTSCNIGDEELLWIANSNQHPVIGQSMYRYNNGRFEQIGQAWLKHGFTALQLNACDCGCTSSGTGTRLGVGCSDPYSSGLNGSQSGMGPKYQVNAATGFFVWPPDDFNNTGNSIYKRLQVAISDIDPGQDGGGMYYVEGQYIAPDDTAAGNGTNNTSYRRATVSGSGSAWTFGLQDSTVREKPALKAWVANDPMVGFRTVTVPGDGQFHLAWRAYEGIGDSYDWEFALHNETSDRSAGGFVVNLPEGGSTNSPGFHDVDYHSGEPFSGTDWAVTEGVGQLRWDTQSFGDNPNANAIRWGTTYNFRFNASFGPDDLTEIDLVLFKPGSPTAVTVPLENDPPPPPPVPANDLCENASPAPFGSQSISTVSSTDSGPAESCGGTGGDVWFNVLAPETGMMTASVCDTDFDAYLAIYTFDACPTTGGTALACSDTGCGSGAMLTMPVVGGQVYRVRVGGVSGQGDGTLDLAMGAAPCDGDTNGDSVVNVEDLLIVLGDWGACGGCPGDLDDSGDVNVDDMLLVLGNWGACP